MIRDDNELKVTQDRVAYFLDLLKRIRIGAKPDEFVLVAGGYRAEVEQMQRDVLDYLTQPANVVAKAG
jgi:hypothetical protein